MFRLPAALAAMTPAQAQANELLAALHDADDPGSVLDASNLDNALELLIGIHQAVTQAALSDPAHARSTAAWAQLIARRLPGDALVQAQAHWTLGNSILYLPDYLGALAHYDRALEWYDRARLQSAPAEPGRDVRTVQIPRIYCLSELGRYQEALRAVAAAEQWLEQFPHDIARLTLLLNRSHLAGTMGDYREMVDLADATIALALSLDDLSRLAQGWINRAWACILLGRFSEAEAAIDRGIAAATEAGEPLTIWRGLWNRAVLLRCQGQLFDALVTLAQAEQLGVHAPGEEAALSRDRAGIYEQLLQLPLALRAARRAATQFGRSGMLAESAGATLDAVRIAVGDRRFRTARALLTQARALARQANLPLLLAELQLAEAAFVAQAKPAAGVARRRAALAGARAALDVLDASGRSQDVARGQLIVAELLVQLNRAPEALALYHSLLDRPSCALRLEAHAGIGGLLPAAESMPHLRQAVALAVQHRRSLPMEELQARYHSRASLHHMRMVRRLIDLGRLEAALQCAWEAKAGPLLDLHEMAGTLGREALARLETAKATIQRLREQEQEHRRKAMQAPPHEQHEQVAYHLWRAEQAIDELQQAETRLVETLHTFGGRGGRAEVPAVERIGTMLAADAVLLEYIECEGDLLCFVLRGEQPALCSSIGPVAALQPLLERLRLMNDPQLQAVEQFRQAVLAPLWEVLLEPFAAQLAAAKEVLIAPCGVLHEVPWAVLWDATPGERDGPVVTLTPCGALWATAPLASAEAVGPPRVLGHAGAGEKRLLHVAAELAAIARAFPEARVSLDATAADLRAGPVPQLLHIATHGHTNAASPLCSALELADGPFLLLEAHRLDLHGTQLVTLSACETSVRPQYGDMMLALSGAFLCAGAQHVLASLWPVADDVTAELMEQFYGALAGGATPALALQLAQRQLSRLHPHRWAGFQLWAGAIQHRPIA